MTAAVAQRGGGGGAGGTSHLTSTDFTKGDRSADELAASEAETLLNRSLGARLWEVTTHYVPLAFITFGGPPAHVALLHDRFVMGSKWINERMFAELFAISTALPGPASTQLAYTIALIRAGVLPGIWGFLLWR